MWLLIRQPKLWDMSLKIFVKFGVIFKETIASEHQALFTQLSFTVKIDKKSACKTQTSKKVNICALTLITCVWMMDRNIWVIWVYLIKFANSAILEINYAPGWAAAAFGPCFSVCIDKIGQCFHCTCIPLYFLRPKLKSKAQKSDASSVLSPFCSLHSQN